MHIIVCAINTPSLDGEGRTGGLGGGGKGSNKFKGGGESEIET